MLIGLSAGSAIALDAALDMPAGIGRFVLSNARLVDIPGGGHL